MNLLPRPINLIPWGISWTASLIRAADTRRRSTTKSPTGTVVKQSGFAYDPEGGVLNGETVELGGDTSTSTTYKFDEFGNIRETSVTGKSNLTDDLQTLVSETRVSKTQYDAAGDSLFVPKTHMGNMQALEMINGEPIYKVLF